MTNSSPSEFTATCTFCSGVSSVTLTGAHDDLDVLCPRCGIYLGSVGELKNTNRQSGRRPGGGSTTGTDVDGVS